MIKLILPYLYILFTATSISSLCAQYTQIPDPIFEEFLISRGFDDVIDGRVINATISDEYFQIFRSCIK